MKFPEDIPTAVTVKEAAVLSDLAAGKTVLEMGSQFGYSTIVMAQTSRLVHSVDTHQGDADAGMRNSLAPFLDNLRFYKAFNVIVHIGTFYEVCTAFRPYSFDLAFLDGSHDTQSVLDDTFLAVQLVKPDGFIAWHDYGRFGVKSAVDQTVSALETELHVVDHLAWVVRP